MHEITRPSLAGAFRRDRWTLVPTLVLALPILAAGCGQKGPLTLPKVAPAASTASAASK